MSDQIVSKEHIRAIARSAYVRGAGRDDHGFNWHAREAIRTWQEEWDRQHAGWSVTRTGRHLDRAA